jgi:three-Cys-motif partner protein
VADPYLGREQTKAKHFILKSYLQALAFKVLTFSDVTYVDGFSGPWESKTEDFSDSSFMIAIHVLKDAQSQILARTGKRRRIRCFFSEKDPSAYALLNKAVVEFHRPESGFEIRTYEGKFEDAVSTIQSFVGMSFPLIFIDPTGWTGYPFDRIKPLFARAKCEVLINFMYDFINRFAHSADREIIDSLAPNRVLEMLAQQGPLKFSRVVAGLLQPFMLRETNVKDICVDHAKAGRIENVWGGGNRKPRDEDTIRLRSQ